MPWKNVKVSEERFRFVLEAEKAEKPFSGLCEDFGISRQTGYKWLRRYRAVPDPLALRDLSRAPEWVGNKTDPRMAREIEDARKRFPFWGPVKLKSWLAQQSSRRKWPAPSTIGRILKSAGLVKPPRRRVRTPPYTKPFSHVTAPNQVWCVDFKGWFKTGDGTKLHPLTIMDAHSRYLIRVEALLEPRTDRVKEVFESAFRDFGLPEAIRSDNGAPFASTGVGGLTELSAWWTRIGIRHERIEPGKPQQNGRHERMHLTLKREACTPPSQTVTSQRGRLKYFRRLYNEQRPHAALGGQTPARLFVPSSRIYSQDVKKELYGWAVERVAVSRAGTVKWAGKTLKVGRALREDLIEVRRLRRQRWCFSYGPVLLGYYDERRPSKELIRPRKARRLSTMSSV